MPILARRYLRTAIAFLILGVLTGLHMSSARHIGAGGFHGPYIVAHTHVLLIGFFLMTIMGTCLWKLPDAPAGSRHLPALDRAAYWLVTLSTIARYTLEIWLGYYPSEPLGATIFVVSCVQSLAIVTFFVNLLPRIRTAG